MNQESTLKSKIESKMTAGAEAWLILNSENFWWKEFDFRTQFNFSKLNKKMQLELTHSKSALVERIESAAELPVYNFKKETNLLFYPASNYFQTKWIVLVTEQNQNFTMELTQQLKNLRIESLRIFAPLQIPSGLKTSFKQIEFISEPI